MYKLSSLILILFSVSIGLVSSGMGRCPTKPNLPVTIWPEFVGTWHEYASFGDGTTRTFYKCIHYILTPSETNVNAQRDYTFSWFNNEGSSKYSVQSDDYNGFNLEGATALTPNIQMWLIDSDYSNYAILYNCVDHLFGAYYTESSWILTRNRTESLDKDVMSKVKKVLKDNSMDFSWYGSVKQSGC